MLFLLLAIFISLSLGSYKFLVSDKHASLPPFVETFKEVANNANRTIKPGQQQSQPQPSNTRGRGGAAAAAAGRGAGPPNGRAAATAAGRGAGPPNGRAAATASRKA